MSVIVAEYTGTQEVVQLQAEHAGAQYKHLNQIQTFSDWSGRQ